VLCSVDKEERWKILITNAFSFIYKIKVTLCDPKMKIKKNIFLFLIIKLHRFVNFVPLPIWLEAEAGTGPFPSQSALCFAWWDLMVLWSLKCSPHVRHVYKKRWHARRPRAPRVHGRWMTQVPQQNVSTELSTPKSWRKHLVLCPRVWNQRNYGDFSNFLFAHNWTLKNYIVTSI